MTEKNTKQLKTLILSEGRVVSVALEPEFWECIELAASLKKMKWTQWAREVLNKTEESGITPTLRLEAVKQIKHSYLFGEIRAEDLAAADKNKFTKSHGMLSDAQLKEILRASSIQGESDFGGFTIIFGVDEHGRDFLAVRNNLLNHPHFMTV